MRETLCMYRPKTLEQILPAVQNQFINPVNQISSQLLEEPIVQRRYAPQTIVRNGIISLKSGELGFQGTNQK